MSLNVRSHGLDRQEMEMQGTDFETENSLKKMYVIIFHYTIKSDSLDILLIFQMVSWWPIFFKGYGKFLVMA